MTGATNDPESNKLSTSGFKRLDEFHAGTRVGATWPLGGNQAPIGRPQALRGADKTRAVLNLLNHGVILTDSAGEVTYMNRRAEKITGRDLAMAGGRSIADILLSTEAEPVCPHSLESSVLGRQRTLEIGTDGLGRCTVELRIVPLPRDYGGEAGGYLYELRDVSESVRRTQQLIHDATHDPLTGLANRRALIERLDQLLQWAPDRNEPESILAVLDLDGFKCVNDDCGHLSGDEMLREVAELLQVRTRKADMAARLGGDEFVVLLPGCGMDAARALMEDVGNAISAYRYHADGVAYRVTASIGVAGIDAETGDAQAVLRRADEACYRAKQVGGDCVVVYGQSEFPESVTALRERAELGIAKRLAEQRNYALYSQPIYRADSAAAVPQRCEILLRIKDRSGDLLTPDVFLPIAYRLGIEADMDRWVIASTAAGWAARHASGNATPLECFINLSRTSIEAAAATADYVSGLLDTWQLPPGVLCFELKERDVLDCRQEAASLIRQLRGRGVHFALDAVGEGMYSLGYLKNLPVDYIKVPAGVILQTETDAFYGAFVDALANVSRSLGIALVGVGAESERILDRFSAYQVTYLQGHALSLPVPFGGPEDGAGMRPAAAGFSPASLLQALPGSEPH
jgi:diguanylate cyclase (GGDEF)-like protein/PAS domain S-box-containing protein